jgi:large subunit ribosomal protein L9
MKILLTQAVKNVGKPGEVKEVANGYARNYLIPRAMAVVATPSAVKQAAAQQDAELRREEKNRSEYVALGEKVAATTLTLRARVGEQHRLYGAITAADIASALSERVGQPIDRRRVELEEPIRHLGEFKVPVRLARDVVPEVTVTVESET